MDGRTEMVLDQFVVPLETPIIIGSEGIIFLEPKLTNLQRKNRSRELKHNIRTTRNIFSKTPTTISFRTLLLQRIKAAYYSGTLPTSTNINLVSIGLNLDHNCYDLFYPDKTEEIERRMYHGLKMLIYGSDIPSDRDALMEASRTWGKEFKERYGKDVIPAC